MSVLHEDLEVFIRVSHYLREEEKSKHKAIPVTGRGDL
jgi:hypothetical protein